MTKTKQALAEPETGADASGHEGATHPLPVARNAPSQAVALATAYSPPELLNRAILQNSDIAVIERLAALAERWQTAQEDRLARIAFNNALADAKAKLPVIRKNKTVSFGTTTYKHEDLAEVVATVVPILSEFGLSHRFRLRNRPGEPISVTCIISHRAGYFEENELSSGPDSSGAKNAIQAVKSAVTYLERITLLASLGLASAEDDDARSAVPEKEPAPAVTPEQVAILKARCAEVKCPEKKFLAWAKVESFEAIPADYFEGCMQGLSSFTKAG
jgi:hypothetical protein